GRRPREAGRDAGLGGAPARLGEELALAQQLARPLLGDRVALLDPALGDHAGHLAADRPDLALEIAHTGLARVIADDRSQGGLADLDLAPRQAVALDLAGHEVALGDLELLLLGVAGE